MQYLAGFARRQQWNEKQGDVVAHGAQLVLGGGLANRAIECAFLQVNLFGLHAKNKQHGLSLLIRG